MQRLAEIAVPGYVREGRNVNRRRVQRDSSLLMPSAGSSTIGPGQRRRQSRLDRLTRSKLTWCGQYVVLIFGEVDAFAAVLVEV